MDLIHQAQRFGPHPPNTIPLDPQISLPPSQFALHNGRVIPLSRRGAGEGALSASDYREMARKPAGSARSAADLGGITAANPLQNP